MNRGRWRPLVTAWVTVLVMATGAWAAERVVFVDGRVLVIAAHRTDGDRITLELDGGGEMTLPASRIRTIQPWTEQETEEPPIQILSAAAAAAAPAVPTDPPRRQPDADSGTPGSPDQLFPRIAELALKYELDTQLVAAVALVESGLDPGAESPKGAKGLMQLMPATARAYGVEDPFDTLQNLEAGIAHLKRLLERYDGNLELALAGYNAGEGAVARYGGVPPFPETIRYVDRVMALATAR